MRDARFGEGSSRARCSRRHALRLTLVSIVLFTLQIQQTARAQVFVAKTTLVPVDVRVVDYDGKPVLGLTTADFTVTDNGVPQTISVFRPHGLAEAAPLEATPAAPDGASHSWPEQGRVFLLLFGRGTYPPVTGTYDAAIAFVRSLLPQDEVAVQAWNRATEFTTRHDEVVHLLTVLKAGAQEIEADLHLTQSGLAGMHGDGQPNPGIQKQIDAIFAAQAGPSSHAVADRDNPHADATAAKRREDEQALLTKDLISSLGGGSAGGSPGVGPRSAGTIDNTSHTQAGEAAVHQGEMTASSLLGTSFDAYIASSVQTDQDVGNLYAGIQYLRFKPGEKHIVYFSKAGVLLPSEDDDESLGAWASDSRVAIDTIHTGGAGARLDQFAFSVRALETFAEASGGQSLQYDYARKALTRINEATASGYELGYYVQTANDGKRHSIKVTVNRRKIDVYYRHDYFAESPLSRTSEQRLRADARITTAAVVDRDMSDLPVSAKLTEAASKEGRVLTVTVNVGGKRLGLTPLGGRHSGTVQLAIFCSDIKGHDARQLGEVVNRTISLSLTDDEAAQVWREGLSVTIPITMPQSPSVVRVVAYDPATDLIGSTYARNNGRAKR